MRIKIIAFTMSPALALALHAVSAAGQVRVGVHIDIPILIGGHPVVVHRPAPPPRYVQVYEYSSRSYGKWRNESRNWRPVTLYLIDGRYYEEAWGRGARPIRVYWYRDHYFFEPRERDWYEYRDRYLRNDDRWDDRDYRDRDDRDYRDDRDQGRGNAGQNNGRGPDNDPRARPRQGPPGRGGK